MLLVVPDDSRMPVLSPEAKMFFIGHESYLQHWRHPHTKFALPSGIQLSVNR
jgi:hypothetical protein